MNSMNAITGKPISGSAHLAQSVRDILTTPVGTRIARREYGSLLPELIDQPFNDFNRMRLFGATATALMRWEPRMRIERIALSPGERAGAFLLELDYRDTTSPTPQSMTVPLHFPNR